MQRALRIAGPPHAASAAGLVMSAAILAGCATSSIPPDARQPEAPPPAEIATSSISATAPATLIGSQESSVLLDDFTAYLVALDGVQIAAGRKGWDTPVNLPAGPHRLIVGFVRGVFTATASLDFEAQSGADYQLCYASDAQIYGDHSYCEFWVVNKNTGEKITGVVRVELTRLKR